MAKTPPRKSAHARRAAAPAPARRAAAPAPAPAPATATEYDNTDRGALFKNNRKTQENHPDYSGSINVGGVDYWLAAWTRTSRNGMKFMSLAVSDKNDPLPSEEAEIESDDDLPF